MILQARCNRGRGPCRINFEYPDGTSEIPVHFACSANVCARHTHEGVVMRPAYPVDESVYVYTGNISIREAAPYMLRCLTHKDMMYFHKLKTSRSSDACSADCLEAEGDKCKCSCGGMNHGTETR